MAGITPVNSNGKKRMKYEKGIYYTVNTQYNFDLFK